MQSGRMKSLAAYVALAAASAAPAHARQGVDGWDGEKLFVLVDADMAATAYADGKLFPIEGATDVLLAIEPKTGNIVARTPVSNSVMGWPGSMAARGGLVAIAAGYGPIDRTLEKADDGVYAVAAPSRALTIVSRDGVRYDLDICERPLSVDVSSNEKWLLVACGDQRGELAVAPLHDGAPQTPRRFDLDIPSFSKRSIDEGASYAVIHPDGNAAGVILENRAVALVRFELDEHGVPVSALAEEPLETDRWLSVARWTKSGGHLLAADVGWGPRALDAVFNRNGEIVSFALSPTNDQRGEISHARVSKSPEGFEMNREGDLLAVVNMERTYLPGGPLALFRKRSASSLSLVTVKDETGILETLGRPVPFRGVLPEDAAFDADGDRVAVVVYQDHGAPKSEGWLTFFSIDGEGAERRAEETGVRIALPRGGHDLLAID